MTDPAVPDRLDRAQSDAVRARQASRARAMAILLLGLAVLFFAVTVVKVGFLS